MLAPWHYEHYKIIEKLDKLAYQLELLLGSIVHPMFHVFQLKPYKGSLVMEEVTLAYPRFDGDLELFAILEQKIMKRRNRAKAMGLIH